MTAVLFTSCCGTVGSLVWTEAVGVCCFFTETVGVCLTEARIGFEGWLFGGLTFDAPPPRTEVYCLRLNLNISKLV